MQGRTITITRHRDLPHWHAHEGTYFVTFRLYDSLRADLARLKGQKRIEEELDLGYGAAHMRRPDVARCVFDALRHFDGQRYVLHSGCVMPNHVHVVARMAPGVSIRDVVHSWKGFTARLANRILGRQGQFWQHEWYDRLIRDAGELDRANAYVRQNPEKAGLRDWPWVAVFDRPFVVRYS